jgi:DNA-binding transcriptional LysR family regulator
VSTSCPPRYDAGIQFGEYLAQDMVAVRVSPDLRPAVVGAPAYFASHPKPTSPRDVLDHQCIRFRHRGESVYKWEFDQGDESLAIAVNGALLLDEPDLVIQAALDGAGLAWVAEDRITEHFLSGALVRVLEIGARRSRGAFCTTRVVGSSRLLSRH